MKKKINIVKRIVEVFFIFLFLFATIFHKLVAYGFDQAKGQLTIVWNARSIVEVMNDASIGDSIKIRLLLMDEIKKFAVDSLGMKATDNYTSFYDQHGKPILWVLTASEKYKLKPYYWTFPVVGKVSYKGFFVHEKGKKEELKMKEEGFDTDFHPTSAWSTLGWFKDPVLSNFLRRGDGQIAELLIHEMTHTTLYVKSSVDFNENLASAIGEIGAEDFLKFKFGDGSKALIDYRNQNEDYNRYASHMLSGTHRLDSIYETFTTEEKAEVKEAKKKQMISEIVASLDTVSFHKKDRYVNKADRELPNNAYFLGFTRYDAQKEEMKKELKEKFGNDIKKYMEGMKNKYQ